jgi:GAF domain-containing protein
VHIRQEVLDRAVEQLRQSQAENGVSLEDAMAHLTDSVISMFGLTGAGLMLVDDDQLVRSVLATEELGWVLEDGQEKASQGPCVDAVVHGVVASTSDVTTDERWPELAAVLADSGIGGVLGVPIRLAGATVGALNVYVDRPHDWDDSDRHALVAFGQLLESLLASALFAEQRDSVVKQLQEALESRVLIERCVGLIMGREGIGAVDAFNRLRDIARPSRRKVHDVARELLAEHG